LYTNNKKYKFYLVTPFVSSIRVWKRKFKKAKQQGRERKNAALKVVMDNVINESEVEEEDNAPLQNQGFSHEYSGLVPRNQQVELENSLKLMLGIGKPIASADMNDSQVLNDDWKIADTIASHMPDPNRNQPIPFGSMPGMELPTPYSAEQFQRLTPTIAEKESDSTGTDKSIKETNNSSLLLDVLLGKQPPTKAQVENENSSEDTTGTVSEGDISDHGSRPKKMNENISKANKQKPKDARVHSRADMLLNLVLSPASEPVKPSFKPQVILKRESNTVGRPGSINSTRHSRLSSPINDQGLSSALQGRPPKLSSEKNSLLDILQGAPPPPHREDPIPRRESLASPQEREELVSLLLNPIQSSEPKRVPQPIKSDPQGLLDILYGNHSSSSLNKEDSKYNEPE
jgi:hypothetical protein